MKVLFVTSQWPTKSHPNHSPFVRVEVENLRKVGIDVDVFHYSGGWRFSTYLSAIVAFHRFLKHKQYDLIQVRFGQCGLVTLTQYRLPVVVRFGGSDLIGWRMNNGVEPLASKLLRTVSRLVAYRATEVIIPAQHMAQFLPKDNYHVIPAGIDLKLFQPMAQLEAREQLELPLRGKLILFAANPQNIIKRFDLAERSVSIVNKTILVDLVVANGIPHQLMPLYMNACDVLLVTSQHEGSPNVVKEALACNLPVVSVDVGDIGERVGKSDKCIVCQQDTPEALAEALLHIIKSGERPALRHLVTHLDAPAVAHQTIKVYEKALSYRS